MSILAFPDLDEIQEIVYSTAAKHSWFNHRAMEFSTTYLGTKFRVALLQNGVDSEVRNVRFILAGTAHDLRDNIGRF
jgi:hypothetical protein